MDNKIKILGLFIDIAFINYRIMTQNNNDKAKKILFGRTDISVQDIMNHDPDKKFIGEEKKFPISDEELKRKIAENNLPENKERIMRERHATSEHKDERNPLLPQDCFVASMDMQNEKLGDEVKYDTEKQQFVDDELHFRAPEPWIKNIRDYCQQNNITPTELLEEHKSMIESLKDLGYIKKQE